MFGRIGRRDKQSCELRTMGPHDSMPEKKTLRMNVMKQREEKRERVHG